MRKNLPVTQQEVPLSETDLILSTTDLQGKITYVNHDFMRVSGFEEHELIGQPHNILRHPDMPEEAFADLWANLKACRAWTGIVKNRCKNGDHYWVEANVSPLMEKGEVIGYTSVRGKASRAQIEAADGAYRAIREKTANLIIRDGQAVPRGGQMSFMALLRQLSIKTRIHIWMGSIILLFAVVIGAASRHLGSSDNVWATVVIACAVLGILIALMAMAALRKNILGSIVKAKQNIMQMSSGDLSEDVQVVGTDEMAQMMQALRILQINVKLFVGRISEAADHVNVGANEIAHGNMDLSTRTEEQASSLEETASAMEELTTTVRKNTENAGHATTLVATTTELAQEGGKSVAQVVSTMHTISDSSRKIVDIISLIDGIAFQTNLLALNAAVEAARAGEDGRGFAVVATEVRNLAQRSASAASEIQQLIKETVSRIENGSTIVDSTGQRMTDIVNSIEQAATLMHEISNSTREQNAGIEHMNAAVGQIDQITQHNAALVEESAAATTSLKLQADRLTSLVGAFKIMAGSKPVQKDRRR